MKKNFFKLSMNYLSVSGSRGHETGIRGSELGRTGLGTSGYGSPRSRELVLTVARRVLVLRSIGWVVGKKNDGKV